MSDCRNPKGRWPSLEIMRRAMVVDDTGLIPFVDTEAAARYLALSPHSLECYRSLGGGPPFYKFGKFVRYAVTDLQAWAADRRHERTARRQCARLLIQGANCCLLTGIAGR